MQSIKSDDWQKDILNRIRDLNEKFDEESQLMPIIRGIAMYCSETESEYYIREIKDATKLGIGVLRGLIKKEHKKIALEKIKSVGHKIFPINEPLPPALFDGYISDDSKLKTTINNLKVLIKNYGITIKRNLISREDEIIIPGCTFNEETRDEASFATLISLCETNSLNKSQHLNSYCSSIASENAYNPVLNCIKSKPWDGKSRLQALYDTIIVSNGFNIKIKELLVRKWLISAVAGASEPDGVFTKGVLIFQSSQSKGKTSWFKSLVPKVIKDYFKDGSNLDPKNKDSIKSVISKWIVELGEIESTLQRDVAMLKAFLSSSKDIFRIVWGKRDTKFARRTVFCGTVNSTEFLKDRTGNVRYWPIAVEKLLSTSHIDMQQLWAEVYEIYKSRERWWLVAEEEKLLEESNERFLETCPYEQTISQYYKPYSDDIKKCPSDNKFNATQMLIKIKKIWGSQLNIDQRGTRAVVNALNRLGFQRKCGNQKRFYVERIDSG